MPRLQRLVCAAAVFVFTIAFVSGCGRHAGNRLAGLPNQPPTVTLSATKVGAGDGTAFDLRWAGHDPDGAVDHFIFTQELRALERPGHEWFRAAETSKFLRPERVATMTASPAIREPDFFAVRAVDDRGAMSEPATFAAFGDSIAPSVQILSPRPSSQFRIFVQSAFEVDFDGIDPDGVWTTLPVKYKYRLFSDQTEISVATILADSDSLRRFYAPTFAGWDSVPSDSSYARFQNFIVGKDYVFAVIAIDEDGLYSPVFSRDTNLLYFRVASGSAPLVTLNLFGDSFAGTFAGPAATPLGVLARLDRRFTVNWLGTPPAGGTIQAYRSAFDPDTLDGSGDGFTPWDVNHKTTSIGPLQGAAATQPHRLVVEARSDQGFIARAIVILHPFMPTFEKDLLVVDDTRRLPDRASRLPQLEWPTAAELDTFLFARGGMPWRFYPAGTLSTPGLFDGYSFDTLGTRTGTANLGVPLETLGRYRHVIWITDGVSATYAGSGTSPTSPMSALRYESVQAFQPLREYLRSGGRVWMVGGGAGKASMIAFNRVNNDQPVMGFSLANNELLRGRMMYDEAGWQSEFRSALTLGETAIHRGGDVSGPNIGSPYFDVSLLPAALEYRAADTDPLPPLRSAGSFYVMNNSIEWLSQPNAFRGRDGTKRVALDTLMKVTLSGSFVGTFPCMTAANDPRGGTVVFSGFDLWSWRRSQCVQVIDAVLNGYWGLQRSAPVASRRIESAAVRPGGAEKPEKLAASSRR